MLRMVGVLAVLSLLKAVGAEAAEAPKCIDGWKIELVAEAPAIRHPSVVCCAPDGRVFVAEDPMDISTPSADVAEGRILCISPGGDVKVFAEGLYAVFGMQYIDGYLFVLHNPKFSRFRDRQGAGDERIDLIEQTNPQPWALDWNDHVPANFRLAMDGYFYVAVGDKGLYGAVGRDGSRVDLRGGGILRLRPDGTELEVYCRGVRNILDVVLDAEGEIFTYDNTDEHGWMGRLTHMVDGGFYGYPYDFQPQQPHTLWMMADFGAGAATGAICYNEDALPAEYHGNLFLADFGKRQILRVKIARRGATFDVVERQDMFIDPPADFRPVGIALVPDGHSIYVCDWGHADTKEKVTCGRLWKLSYGKPSMAAAKPAWFTGNPQAVSIDELIQALSHPSEMVRLAAQRHLVKRGAAAEQPLVDLLSDGDAIGQARCHALWALDAIDAGRSARKQILSLASVTAGHEDQTRLRRQAIRQLGTRRVVEAHDRLVHSLNDADAGIRFQAAVSLGRLGQARSVEPLLSALVEDDLYARYACFSALNRIGKSDPEAWPSIVAELASGSPDIRHGAALAVRETWDLALVDALRAFVEDESRPATSCSAAIELLAAIARREPEWKGQWWAYHPALAASPAKTESWAGTELIFSALRFGMADRSPDVRRASAVGLRAASLGGGDLDRKFVVELRDAYADETDSQVRRTLLAMLGAARDRASLPHVAAVLSNPGEDEELTLTAILAAEQIGGQLSLSVLELIKSDDLKPRVLTAAAGAVGRAKLSDAAPPLAALARHADEAVRLAALEALANVGDSPAAAALREIGQDEQYTNRNDALAALGAYADAQTRQVLLAAVRSPDVRRTAILSLTKQPHAEALDAYLDGLADAEYDVRQKCAEAIAATRDEARTALEARASQLPPPIISRLQEIYRDDAHAKNGPIFSAPATVFDPAAYLAFVRENTGDKERGRIRFHDPRGMGCAKCHKAGGQGGEIGPDLSQVGEQFDRATLAEHVLYPGKAIREGYQQVAVSLETGQVVSGLVASETTDELTLRDSEGKLHAIPKSQIESRNRSPLSLMPEKLVEGLSPEAFGDLVSYLQSLRRRDGQ